MEDKYSIEWFLDKLDDYISLTGARKEELQWVISEDLKDLLLKKHMYSEYCTVGLIAKDLDKYVKDISSQVVIKYMKSIATILNIVCIYTDELKDTAILIKVR